MQYGTEMFGLSGRVALVTGAGRGIGLAFAQGLASAGAHVVINDILEKNAKAAAEDLRNRGWSAEALAFDVSNIDRVRASVDDIVARHGRLDILMNNAGILVRKPIEPHEMEDWDRVIGINLSSVYSLARECARPMRRQKYGRIINTSSVMGVSARPGVVSYVAAKHGVIGLTRAMASELGPDEITVNAIGPGYFLTEINKKVLGTGAFEQQVIDRTPLGRWAEPKELMGSAIFLASEASSFITGHTLIVDGGMTANAFLAQSVDLGVAS